MKRKIIYNAHIITMNPQLDIIPQGYIVIENGKIRHIGKKYPGDYDAEYTDAEGMFVLPGFINTHSHMEPEIIKHPAMRSVIEQGITTECLGQDGSSVAPLTDDLVQELADNMAPLAGILDSPYPWRSFKETLI